MGDRGFQHAKQLPLVSRERAPDERCPQRDGQGASVNRRQVVDDAGFQLRPHIRRSGKLSLRQAINAVVFNDVDDRQIAPHQVHKLPDPNGGSIPVTADSQRDQPMVRQHRPSSHRRHAPMHSVKAVRAVHEISRALGRTSDAARLDHMLRLHSHLIHRVNDALGNRIVAAAGAQRRPSAPVVNHRQADAICFRRRRAGCGRHTICPPWS